MRAIVSLFGALLVLVAQAAAAQDPPGRVGRLAYIEGNVSVFQDPDQGWERAYRNLPITSENSVWTDPRSRAEVRISGMALRLDQTTQLDVANLDFDDLTLFVPQGSVAVRVRHFENDQRLDVTTPHGRFRLYGVGRFRLDVDPESDETVFTVFSGTGAMRAAGHDVKVDTGGALRVRGGERAWYVREPARSTGFDRWTLARDDKWIERRSTQYVSHHMTGYEELDAYGEWIEEPEYGHIWYPTRVARDWVPYRHGRWAWVRPWGWTWVGDEPWGYAPYHYGRWVYVRDRWAWWPGPREPRPVWAPALVAWVGGSNFSVSVGGGAAPALGWYPLAPWERYDPWYRANPTYVNRINVVVRDRPPREWRERRDDWRTWNRERAATIVRRDQFREGTPVTQAVVPVRPEVIRQAQVAPPTNILPGPQEFRRAARTPAGAPVIPGSPTAAPQQQAGQPAQPATAETGRTPRDRGPANRPHFGRAVTPPAAPAPATPQQAQQEPPRAQPAPGQQQAAQPSPQASPTTATTPSRSGFARDDARTQERAAREAQREQERAAREAEQQRRQAERQAEQQRRQAQPEAPRAQPAPGQQQAAQPSPQASPQTATTPSRSGFGRDDARTQERAAREAEQQRRAQEQAQRQQQQAQEQARRQAEQQRQAQQQAQQQQQQQQQQLQQQQQAQERAAREAQRQQEQATREQRREARKDEREQRKEDRAKEREEEEKGKGRRNRE